MRFHIKQFLLNARWMIVFLLCGVVTIHAAELPGRSTFDHTQTGFPLTGGHAQVECHTCHLQGIFKGTSRQCEVCHTQGSRIASTVKPNNHPQTAMPCNQCHVSSVSWTGARFDHVGVAPGSCIACHNGVSATGKPARHVVTTASCDQCHRTTAWIPAGYNHANVVPGTCETCHITGGIGTPRPGGSHPPTGSCDDCHSTRNWNYSHSASSAGQCNTCHGVTATGKNTRHIPTTLSCDACHTYTRPFSFNSFRHRADQGVVPTQCNTCHTGSERGTYDGARGPKDDSEHRQADHAICDDCHVTTTWDPIAGARSLQPRKFKWRKR